MSVKYTFTTDFNNYDYTIYNQDYDGDSMKGIQIEYSEEEQKLAMQKRQIALEERRKRLEAREREEKELLEKRLSHIKSVDYIESKCLHEFTINREDIRNHYGGSYRFYTDKLVFKPGINLLFGGNGQGKSSLIEYLEHLTRVPGKYLTAQEEIVWDYCSLVKSEGAFEVYTFSNSKNNARYDYQPQDTFTFFRHFQSTSRSEGQSVMQSVNDFLSVLNDDKVINPDKDYIILIDEIDSGLDAINCRYLVNKIKKILKRKPKLQVFVAFNQYEMTKLDSVWLNVCTGEFEDCPKTYEEYFERLNKNKSKYRRKVDTEVRR